MPSRQRDDRHDSSHRSRNRRDQHHRDRRRPTHPIGLNYVQSGAVDHGYATTIHKAQGVTCDHIHVVGPAGLYREAAYVSLSRARRSAHLYATTRDAATVGEPGHTTGIPLASENVDDPETDLTTTIADSRAKQFVTAEHPDIDRIANLATHHDLAALTDRLHHVRTIIAEVTESGRLDPAQAIDELQLAEHHRRRMTVGGRVNARDWDNVGVVERLHDSIGQATVRFTSDTGQTRSRRLPWHLLKPIDHPEEVELTDLAESHLTELLDEIETAQVKWIVELADRGVTPDEIPTLQAAIKQRREQLARALRAAPPDWLTTCVGDRPTDATAATVYDDLVARLAHWRDQHRLPSEVPGFGRRPDDPALADEWARASEQALVDRCYLLDHQPSPATVVPTLDQAAIRERLEDLDALLATAPADQRHIVANLLTQTGDGLTDTIEALRTAAECQELRRDWILEHWPHIVEHHELTKLEQNLSPLAHWPTTPPPMNSATTEARATLDRWLIPTASHSHPSIER